MSTNTLKRQCDKCKDIDSTLVQVKKQKKSDMNVPIHEGVFDDTPYILISVEQLSGALWCNYIKYNPSQSDKKGRAILDCLISYQDSKYNHNIENAVTLYRLLDKWFTDYNDMDENDTNMYQCEHTKILKKIDDIVSCGGLKREDLKQFDWNIRKKYTKDVKCYMRVIQTNEFE